jgi:hypothetical protein
VLVGRSEAGTLSQAGKIIGAMHRLKSGGKSQSDQTPFGTITENRLETMRMTRGLIRGKFPFLEEQL